MLLSAFDWSGLTLDLSPLSFRGYTDNAFHFLAKLTFVVHFSLMLTVFFIYPITVLVNRKVRINEFRIRFVHMVIIMIITINTVFGIECQLTSLERIFMVKGDEVAYKQSSFISHYADEYMDLEVDNFTVRIIAGGLLFLSYIMFWRRPLSQSRNFDHWANQKIFWGKSK